jgi:hypothetical protein
MNEDYLKEEIAQSNSRANQLIILRWQAFGFVVAISTAVWVLITSRIFDKFPDFGVIYLLIFLGILFSISIVLVWRYVTHQLTNEERTLLDNKFIFQQLLNSTELNSKESKKTEDNIFIPMEEVRNNELKILHLKEGLSNEFDNFDKPDFSFYKMFSSLDPLQRHQLAEKINYKRFEKWQWIYDIFFLGVTVILWIIGGFLFPQIMTQTSDDLFFNFFKEQLWWIFFYILLLLPFLFLYYMSECITPNFFMPNSKWRRELIERFIRDIKVE